MPLFVLLPIAAWPLYDAAGVSAPVLLFAGIIWTARPSSAVRVALQTRRSST